VNRSWEELARIAHDIAREAGALALDGWRGQLEIRKKGRTDLVTHLDLASERLIKARLAEKTPEIPVVGEESGGEVVGGLQWYADPIDGTTNFAHGHPIWSVCVGLLNDGWPVAGAVVAPVLQMDWIGWQGGPALRNGAPISVSKVSDVTEAYLGTGFPYANRDVEPDNNFASYVRVKQVVQAVRRIGSAALDCCFVAEGIYDGYWERSLNAWDVAAALAVVLSAGGKVTHLDGSPPDVHRGNLLVTNGLIHEPLSQLVIG
jgi:myo-inositol-1(or 4)-monophosphatase